MSKNTIAMFLNEVKDVPLLSREEEEKTALAAAAGDKAARDKLVNANLRFVVSVAKRYQGLGMPLEDLIAEGSIGLINAADRFNVGKSCRFISYAVWWIRQSILSALCEKSRMIRLPTNRAAELVKIEKARKLIKRQHSMSKREEIREIANLLSMDRRRVEALINISRNMLSLDTPFSKSHDGLLRDVIKDDHYDAPEQDANNNLMEEDIESVLSTLSRKEAEIIRRHYGLGCHYPMSLKDIGAMYNLSKERIRQIEERALCRLKNPKCNKKLQAYVA